MSYKGFYTPLYPEKYLGDAKNIVYRSLWERKFCIYCDTNENILEWASEEMNIKYFDPVHKKIRRYFPDFYIKVREENNNTKKYIIEIKPAKQTVPPKKPQRQTKRYLNEVYEYSRNQMKWEAARNWCTDNGFEFKIITEKQLNIRN